MRLGLMSCRFCTQIRLPSKCFRCSIPLQIVQGLLDWPVLVYMGDLGGKGMYPTNRQQHVD